MHSREQNLLAILSAFFLGNAVIAEFIGVKIFSLERLLGMEPTPISLLGQEGLTLSLSAGVILWPWVFITTDLINEYYGLRAVRRISLIGAGVIAYALVMVYAAMSLPPADFWIWREMGKERLYMPTAFSAIFGQSMWIVAGSLTAFLIGQLVDVVSFHWLRRMTGGRWLAVRATGSTLISQLVDSFVVLYIAFYWGAGWSFAQVTVIGLLNYAYKATVAVLLTPVLYGVHELIDWYLGAERAQGLIKQAAQESAWQLGMRRAKNTVNDPRCEA